MARKKPHRHSPNGYTIVPGPIFRYQTGAAFGAGFWLVVAIPFGVVGRSTHGIVSDVFYAIAALFAGLAAIHFAFYATGHNGGTNGHWIEKDPPNDGPRATE